MSFTASALLTGQVDGKSFPAVPASIPPFRASPCTPHKLLPCMALFSSAWPLPPAWSLHSLHGVRLSLPERCPHSASKPLLCCLPPPPLLSILPVTSADPFSLRSCCWGAWSSVLISPLYLCSSSSRHVHSKLRTSISSKFQSSRVNDLLYISTWIHKVP